MKQTILTLYFLSSIAFAHDGEHGVSAVQAPKGGVMKSLETVHLELINEGKKIKIYTYDTELKSAAVTNYPVSATVTFPKKKPQVIKLIEAQDHWEVEVDFKNAHRYTLVLNIKQGGHDDKVKWVIEPKK